MRCIQLSWVIICSSWRLKERCGTRCCCAQQWKRHCNICITSHLVSVLIPWRQSHSHAVPNSSSTCWNSAQRAKTTIEEAGTRFLLKCFSPGHLYVPLLQGKKFCDPFLLQNEMTFHGTHQHFATCRLQSQILFWKKQLSLLHQISETAF